MRFESLLPAGGHGVTIPELLVALTLLATMLAVAMPKLAYLLDRAHVGAARTEIVSAFSAARQRAIMRGRHTALAIDDSAGTIALHEDSTTVFRRDLGELHGVTLTASRDSMAYYPNGLGYGAANLSIVIARNRVSDTVFVSRLGRVRH